MFEVDTAGGEKKGRQGEESGEEKNPTSKLKQPNQLCAVSTPLFSCGISATGSSTEAFPEVSWCSPLLSFTVKSFHGKSPHDKKGKPSLTVFREQVV